MSKYVFVKAEVCWADEFECEMFGVFPKEKWENLVAESKSRLSKYKPEKDEYGRGGELEIYFGTNEELQISDFKQWFNEFTVKSITEEEAKILRKLFCPEYKQKDVSFTWGTGDGFFDGILNRLDKDGNLI